ncbi:MAG TPA: ATPase, T2SS/T4P/T4SS family, partial [Burkholderiales bacterium]|nr:ATPase, T2SS/T4P/T4SS family [Burkholderiales bacterium]
MAIQLNSSLARALVQQNKLTESDAKAFELAASSGGNSFVSELIKSRRIDPTEIAMFASQTFGFPLFDLDAISRDSTPSLIDTKLMQKHRVAALYKRGNRLFVAISNPENMQGLDEIKFKTGLAIEPVIVEDDKLGAFIQKAAEFSTEGFNKFADEEIDLNLEFIDEVAKTLQPDTSMAEIEDAPIVKFIQKSLLDAINAGASDIHFEPYEKFYRIRYRIDGMLYEIAQPPIFVKEKLASRLKVISRLDISERRVPQDGRLKLALSETHAIDFRISTLPTLFGEKIVLRLLDSDKL